MFLLRISNHIVCCNPGMVLIAEEKCLSGFPELFLVMEEEQMLPLLEAHVIKPIQSQKGRFCLRKEGFIFVYSFALAYICYEMNKLRNVFLSTKGRFLSTKGRFYLRKEGCFFVYIVVPVLDFKCEIWTHGVVLGPRTI